MLQELKHAAFEGQEDRKNKQFNGVKAADSRFYSNSPYNHAVFWLELSVCNTIVKTNFTSIFWDFFRSIWSKPSEKIRSSVSLQRQNDSVYIYYIICVEWVLFWLCRACCSKLHQPTHWPSASTISLQAAVGEASASALFWRLCAIKSILMWTWM